MAVKIQLTPQELLAQSQEMKSLQKEYETLFRQSETLLGQVNKNWSANLANNFSGKLLSAQQGFRQITSMLEAGGRLAAESARGFESIDSLLEKQNGPDSPLSLLLRGAMPDAAAGASVFADALGGMAGQAKSDWERAGGALEELEKLYESMPEDYKSLFGMARKKLVPKKLDASYEITKDILTGEVSWDTAKHAGKAVLGGTNYSIIKKAVEEALDPETRKKDAAYVEAGAAQLKEGNVLSCLTLMGGSFVDEVVMGSIDIGGHVLMEKFVSKIPGVSFIEEQFGFDLTESYDKGMEIIREGVTKGVEKAGKLIGEAEENVRDALAGAGKEIAKRGGQILSAVGDGFNKIKDGAKKLWPF